MARLAPPLPSGERSDRFSDPGERLSGLSSSESELLSDIASLGVEADEELSGECDADAFFGFAGGIQPAMEVREVRIVSPDDLGDDEEDGSHGATAASDVSVALSLPLSLARGARPASLAMALLERVPISGIGR